MRYRRKGTILDFVLIVLKVVGEGELAKAIAKFFLLYQKHFGSIHLHTNTTTTRSPMLFWTNRKLHDSG